MNTTSFFEDYFDQAEVNCMLVMDTGGIIIKVNKAFTRNFGYNTKDLKGKSFAVLFNEKDNSQNKPALELQEVLTTGQANDDNYMAHKAGHMVLATGESILTTSPDGKQYIVKDIVNLQAKKYLKLFLTETEELLERIFESSKEVAMIVLDASMKILKVNPPFRKLFKLGQEPRVGSSLASLKNNFWNRSDVREEIRTIIVTNMPLKHGQFFWETGKGKQKIIQIDSRIIDKGMGRDKKIFIMVEEKN